jgi:hypothetical protein
VPAVPGRDSRWGGRSVGVCALCGRDVRGWSWDDHVRSMSCRHLPRDHRGIHVWFLRALWGWDVFCHARSHIDSIMYHLSSWDLLGQHRCKPCWSMPSMRCWDILYNFWRQRVHFLHWMLGWYLLGFNRSRLHPVSTDLVVSQPRHWILLPELLDTPSGHAEL